LGYNKKTQTRLCPHVVNIPEKQSGEIQGSVKKTTSGRNEYPMK
jgi:hypothetical protein